MASITAAAFKKLSAFDKRAKLIGADIWPIEAIGEGDNKELQVTAVHRASAETVNSIPVNETVRHSLGLRWFLFFDASDAQRSLVQQAFGDGVTFWSGQTLMIDLQSQLDAFSTIDELGKWQGKIAEACDCPKLKEKVLSMPTPLTRPTASCPQHMI